MFGFIKDTINNLTDVAEDALDFRVDGEKVKQLAEDGLTVYEIASIYNVSTDLIETILED